MLTHFQIKESTQTLYNRMMTNKAIARRHFALNQLTDVLERDHEKILARFQEQATQLSTQSLMKALQAANIKPHDIDYLALTTCTGYVCPGLTSFVMERAGLKSDVRTSDLVGMGCGAAVPALDHAVNFTKAHPGSVAAVICTEICSAAMFSNDEIDLVVSNSIFSDGSAAILLRGGMSGRSDSNAVGAESGHPAPKIKNFASLTIPEWRESLRFKTENGYLKNVLGKEVPQQAGQALKKLSARLLADNGLTAADITHWIIHPGGEKVLQEVEKALGLQREHTQAAWNVLHDHGNMSSASVLFVLQEEMKIHPPQPGEKAFLCSFGAGFSAHAALLEF